MSRRRRHAHDDYQRFPRVSGDEPTIETAAELAEMFSPRERG